MQHHRHQQYKKDNGHDRAHQNYYRRFGDRHPGLTHKHNLSDSAAAGTRRYQRQKVVAQNYIHYLMKGQLLVRHRSQGYQTQAVKNQAYRKA